MSTVVKLWISGWPHDRFPWNLVYRLKTVRVLVPVFVVVVCSVVSFPRVEPISIVELSISADVDSAKSMNCECRWSFLNLFLCLFPKFQWNFYHLHCCLDHMLSYFNNCLASLAMYECIYYSGWYELDIKVKYKKMLSRQISIRCLFVMLDHLVFTRAGGEWPGVGWGFKVR